jgi:UDP-GlcNAc3NAcA epimerase
MIKILTVIGARPQFIKAASVSNEFAKHDNIEEIIAHTGQHYDKNMSDIFFSELNIPKPKYFLTVNNTSHGKMIGKMIEDLEEVCLEVKPDWILVYGDTNTTLSASIIANKVKIKLAHVEAGIRSHNTQMVEEINRILTDRVSSALFCPTQLAYKNLIKEGFLNYKCNVMNTGDVMLDSVLLFKNLMYKPLFEVPSNFVLVTVHRPENTDSFGNLNNIMNAIEEISLSKKVIFPIHPRTRKILDLNNYVFPENLMVVDPVSYLEMLWLLSNCFLIITDSGGLQKEAYFCKKRCITLRYDTEWWDLVDSNNNFLVGNEQNKIVDTFNNADTLFSKKYSLDIFGNGKASSKIVNYFLNEN